MKKRAQPPDAYTYTILLRGLATHAKYPQSLPRALSIYNSMYAENSPVRPSIIHTNAVLNVCAHARDLDAMFEVAAKLPSKGRCAPNHWTYTTIINALIDGAKQESEELRHYSPDNPDKAMEPVRRAVVQVRRMWVDISGRWRSGEMQIDEMMVCAIGRLLLMGNTEHDWDDVLSLIEQTMGIQRKIPRLGDPARKTHITAPRVAIQKLEASAMGELSEPESVQVTDPSAEDVSAVEHEAFDGSSSISDPLQPFSNSSGDSDASINHPNEFDLIPIKPKDPPRSLVCPSNTALSLLVNACTLMNCPSTAQSYWGLLTSAPYNITPDSENIHAYLRMLRLARASRLASTLVKDMATPRKEGGLGIPPVPKTFRVAMSCCMRDGKNPNAIGHAEIILRLMNKCLEEPDLKATQTYVNVLTKVCDLRNGRDWRSILVALGNMEVTVNNLRSQLAYGSWRDRDYSPPSSPPPKFEHADDADDQLSPLSENENEAPNPSHSAKHHRKSDTPDNGIKSSPETRLAVRQILRRMVTLYDRVRHIAGEALTKYERGKLVTSRARLQAWVEREMEKEGLKEKSRRRRVGERGALKSRDGGGYQVYSGRREAKRAREDEVG